MGQAAYLTPATFGFGPSALAVAVACALRELDPTTALVGVGDGAAAQHLTMSGRFDSVVTVPEGRWEVDDARTGVVVSFADFDRAAAARAGKAPVVVVDPLYWMWNDPPIDPASVSAYLCPAFPGVEDRIRDRPVAGLRSIAQIVHPPAARTSVPREGVIMNLGGAVSPHGGNLEYLAALVTVVAEALADSLGGSGLLVTCSREAAGALRSFGLPAAADVRTLPSQDMMRALEQRALLLTVAGQSIVWEALLSQIPTVLLPGANYSQHRQVVAYRQIFESTPIVTWNDLPGYATLPGGMPESEGVAAAIALGQRFQRDARARDAVRALLRKILGGSIPAIEPVRGNPWASLDGAQAVAREALRLLRGRRSAAAANGGAG